MKALFAFYNEIEEWQRLGPEFPGIDFVFAPDLQSFSGEIADTDILFILSPMYEKPIADIVNAKALKLKWIQATTVGVDNILLYGVPDGVIVSKAAGIFDVNVAEQAMALLLALLRQVAESAVDRAGAEYKRDLRWDKTRSLERKNVGVVGYGGIGKQLCRRLKAFDTRVLVYDVINVAENEYVDEFFEDESFAEFLSGCDIVFLSLPLTKDNVYMFNKETFGLMKEGGILVNVSRGKLVNENDLADALESGRIAGACLDVFEEEPLQKGSRLWGLDNVVMSPHLGGQGEYNNERLAELFKVNIGRFVNGEHMMYVVDENSAF